MKDVRITKKSDGTWGLLLEDGLFQWAEDGTQAAQHALIRLMFFAESQTTPGHYTLNNEMPHKTSMGTRWYTVIFDMSKSQAEKDFEIKRRFLGTPGIQKITKWDPVTVVGHTMYISGQGKTAWGVVDLSQEIVPL